MELNKSGMDFVGNAALERLWPRERFSDIRYQKVGLVSSFHLVAGRRTLLMSVPLTRCSSVERTNTFGFSVMAYINRDYFSDAVLRR